MKSRPYLIADRYRIETAYEIALQPGSSRAAVTIAALDPGYDAERSTLYLFDLESGERSAITDGISQAGQPRWAPTGGRLAFTSAGAAEAGRSLATLSVSAGTEVPQAITAGLSVESFCWAPDGESLCFVAKSLKTERRGPRVVAYDERFRRESGCPEWFDARYRQLHLVTLDGGVIQLTDAPTHHTSPCFAPNGREIVFCADLDGNGNAVWALRLDRLDAPPDKISITRHPASAPSYSPDGRQVAYYAASATSEIDFTPMHLWVTDRVERVTRDLTARADLYVENVLLSETRPHPATVAPIWSVDGGRLYVVLTSRGRANLAGVSLDGNVEMVTGGDHEVFAYDIDVSSGRWAGIVSTPTDPGSVHSGTLGAATPRVVNVNCHVAEVEMAVPEPLCFRGPGGEEIEGWFVWPIAGRDRQRLPLVVRVAGGPHLAYGYSFTDDVHLLAALGVAQFYCNPRGSGSYGQEFGSIEGRWCDVDVADLLAGLDHVLGAYPVDPARVGLMGASYGSFLTNWIICNTDRFAAAVSQRGFANLVSLYGTADVVDDLIPELGGADPYREPGEWLRLSPIFSAHKCRTPVLLIQSGSDFHTPTAQAEEFFTALRRAGATARLVVYPDEQHYMRRYGRPSDRDDYTQRMLDWFATYLDLPQAESTAADAEAKSAARSSE